MWFFKKKKPIENSLFQPQPVIELPEPVAKFKVVEKKESITVKKCLVHIETKSQQFTTEIKSVVGSWGSSNLFTVDLVTGADPKSYKAHPWANSLAPAPKQILAQLRIKDYYYLPLDHFIRFKELLTLSFIEYGTGNHIILPTTEILAIAIEPEVDNGTFEIVWDDLVKIDEQEKSS